MIRVLIVDDSPLMRRLMGEVLDAAHGFEVSFARNGAEAIELTRSLQPDVITLDVEMPEMDGLTCLDRIMLDQPRPVVMVSALTTGGADATLRAIELGAVDFVPKPSGPISLEIDELAPILREKIMAASKVRLAHSYRLVERVRAHTARLVPRPQPYAPLAGSSPMSRPAAGDKVGAVLVGCSTGGPLALECLIGALPKDFPWPILVAQHMPAAFTGPLARRLDGLGGPRVIEVAHAMPIAPGSAYLARGDADLVLATRSGGLVALPVPSNADYRWHPSVDRLVDSAQQHLDADRLIAVLLTGMGNDGASAMTRLRRAGGFTIAEADNTAVIWGMPGELVKSGGAAEVIPLDAIPRRLLQRLGEK